LNGDWARARDILGKLAANEVAQPDTWTFRIAIQTGHLNEVIELIEQTGADERWRPLYEALRAIHARSRQHLRRVAPEVRNVAGAILTELAPELTD
jgi:hypothetical protein